MSNQYNLDNNDDEERFFNDFERLGDLFAQAKSERSGLDHYRKSLRSRLMVEASKNGSKSNQSQQRDAEASEEYYEIISAFEAAVLKESSAYMKLELLRLKFEKWRTTRADERAAMNMR